jgi:hypothetical protein
MQISNFFSETLTYTTLNILPRTNLFALDYREVGYVDTGTVTGFEVGDYNKRQ